MSILDNFDVVGVPRTFSIAEVRILKNRISFNLATASEIRSEERRGRERV